MRALLNSATEVKAALRRELLNLAQVEQDRAASEAAAVPYWSPCPPSVVGHRAAAAALRADADTLLPHLTEAR
jgi:hypothetical protein